MAMGNIGNETTNAVDVAEHQGASVPKGKRSLHITRINAATIIVSLLLIAVAVFLTLKLIDVTGRSNETHERYKACSDADIQLMEASDYLTTQARLFATTGDRTFMDNYFEEFLETKRRDKALATLEEQGGNEKAKRDLANALKESNELALVEEYSMRLVAEAEGITDLPQPVEAIQLGPDDEALTPEKKRELAVSLVIGEAYDRIKTAISQDVESSSQGLVSALNRERLDIEQEIGALLTSLVIIGVLLIVVVALGGFATSRLVIRPMKIHAKNLAQEKSLDRIGCFEIMRVVDSYNELFNRVQERAEHFKHEAEVDALTGLLNRGSFDRAMSNHEKDCALVLADIDHFKEINDQYGHETGDKVIQAVATIIESHFRSSDYVCRLGGDEFAIILPNMKPENRATIESKLTEIAKMLDTIEDDPLKVTLSFGIAFGDDDTEDLYNDADTALYESKRNGRNRMSFYKR